MCLKFLNQSDAFLVVWIVAILLIVTMISNQIRHLHQQNQQPNLSQNHLGGKVACRKKIFSDKNVNVRRRCTLPNHPESGKWSTLGTNAYKPGASVPSATILKLECNQHFKADGQNLIFCDNDKWTPKPGRCLSMPSDDQRSIVGFILLLQKLVHRE